MLENSALVWYIVITERETVETATLIVMTVTYKLPSTIAVVGGYFFFPFKDRLWLYGPLYVNNITLYV